MKCLNIHPLISSYMYGEPHLTCRQKHSYCDHKLTIHSFVNHGHIVLIVPSFKQSKRVNKLVWPLFDKFSKQISTMWTRLAKIMEEIPCGSLWFPGCSCGSVVEHCVSSAKGCGFNSQKTCILIKKCNVYPKCMLWIKASAKCVNVNE